MQKYFAYFLTSIKAEFAYKADFILSMIMNLVFFAIYFAVWKTVYSQGNINEIDSYTLSNIITYYFVTTIIFRVSVNNYMYLGWDIWSGNFTNVLIKPWNVLIVEVAISVADIILNFLLLIPLLAGIVIFSHSYVQIPGLATIGLFMVTLIIAITLDFMINFIIHSFTFYFGDQEINAELINYLIAFMAGAFFPLVFLPSSLSHIFGYLPFRFLFDVPVRVFLNKISTVELLQAWGQAMVWILIFYVIFYFVYQKGLKRYSGIGR